MLATAPADTMTPALPHPPNSKHPPRETKAWAMALESVTEALKQEAYRLGFDLAGACRAVSPPGIRRFRQWLAAGYTGEMRYFGDRAEAYEHPRHVLKGVQSLLMLATGYRTVEPAEARPGQGRISRYAWGADYHHVIHARLHRLAHYHRRSGAPDKALVWFRKVLELDPENKVVRDWVKRLEAGGQ